MSPEDKTLTCTECGEPFRFTVDEQAFFAARGLLHEPRRCAACRAKRRSGTPAGPGNRGRERVTVVCAACGQQTTVPFQPAVDRPVYCPACFQARRKR